MEDKNKPDMKSTIQVNTQELVNMLYTLGDMRNDLLTDMYTNHHTDYVYVSSHLYETMVVIRCVLQDKGYSAERINDIWQVVTHDVSIPTHSSS